MGYDLTTGVGGTGILAVLRNGPGPKFSYAPITGDAVHALL